VLRSLIVGLHADLTGNELYNEARHRSGATPRVQRFQRIDIAVAVERDFLGSEATAFFDVIRDADRAGLAVITRQLYDLSVCDASTNDQWAQFSGVIRSTLTWLSGLLIRLPCWVPALWLKSRGGAVLINSPAT
jgi:hypothetical protein